MKPFTEYLIDVKPKYEFVVRVAGCDTVKELKDRAIAGLSMYVVESSTDPKRLPIQEHADFPGLGACEVHMFEVTLKYPTITEQVAAIVAENLGISRKTVLVRTKKEDQLREIPAVNKTAKNDSLLNNTEMEAESAQDLVGHKRIDSMLKELQSRRYEFAQQAEAAKSVDLPQGVKSPVGSNPVKHSTPKGK